MIVGKLTVLLGLDSKGFTTGINSATGKTTAFAKATDKTFKAIGTAAKIGMLAVGAAFIKGAVDAAKFEKALANVSTMLNKKTMPMMKEFEKGILDMSEAYGESTDALAKGLYDILSAGIPAAKALDVLKVSAQAAKAGITDTGVAADAITTLMNSFGDATKDASYYSDVLFATVLNGKTTFAELAPVIGNVAKLMETAGGTAEDMAGMLSILTANGIQTRVAVTSVKGLVTALIKPSKELTEKLGGMTVKADGFRAVMDKVGALPVEDLGEMFPNVRALTAVAIAAKGFGEELEGVHEFIKNGEPTTTAMNKQMNTLATIWDQFKATLKVTSITIGNELLPVIKEILKDMTAWFKKNREGFAEFAKVTLEGIRKLVTTIFDLKEIILIVGSGILGMMVLSKITPLMTAFGISTAGAMGPVGLIAAAIGLLIGAFFKLRSELRTQTEQQELLDAAQKKTLASTEDYNEAIRIQQNRIDAETESEKKRQIVIAQNIATGRLSEKDARNAASASYTRMQNLQGQMTIIKMNAKDLADIRAAEKADAEGKATQEQIDFLASVARETERQRIQDEADQADRQRDAEEAQREEDMITSWTKNMQDKIDIQDDFEAALFNLTATEAEKWAKEKAMYEAAGISQEKILEFFNAKFPKAVEEASEATTEFADDMDMFWDHELVKMGEVDEALIVVADSFVDKWTKAVEKVSEIFNLLYSSMTGTVNQYFENMFSKLDNEKAEKIKNAKATITDEDKLAAALTKIDEDAAKKKYELELKQFKVTKALNIAAALMNTAEAVSKALTLIWPLNLIFAGIVGALGAVQVGLIAGQQAPAAPFIRGGLVDNMIDGGVVRGSPGIDTNQIAVTNREYVMPPQQTADNLEELEAMRSGDSGKNITIVPAQVDLVMNDRTVGTAIIEFMTEESDRGGFRINPKVLGELT